MPMQKSAPSPLSPTQSNPLFSMPPSERAQWVRWLREYLGTIGGTSRSEPKVNAARANIAKAQQACRRPLESYPCTCGTTDDDTHRYRCPRGKVIYSRRYYQEHKRKKG